MRILFLAPQPFYRERGTCMATLRLLKALSKLGHVVDVLTYYGGTDVNLENVSISRVRTFPFMDDISIGPSKRKFFFDFYFFWAIIGKLIANRYDIVHAIEESAFLAALLKKVFKINLLYDMDSIMSDQMKTSKFAKYKALVRMVENCERFAVKNSDVILSVCSSLSESARAISPQGKIFQIEDVPMLEESHSPSLDDIERLKEKYGVTGKRVVMYIGNLEPYQGVDLFLKSIPSVIQRVSDCLFIIVGGLASQVKELRNLAGTLGIGQSVIFTGKQPLERIPAFMHIADVLVSPRIQGTNTPFKIYEYLYSAKPVVATDLPTHTQVLTSEVAFLAGPDPEDFAASIVRSLTDEALSRKIGEAGAVYVRKNYSQETFFKKVDSLYRYIETTVQKRAH